MSIMRAEPGTLRKINERRIMNALRIHGTLSRTDLQRELQLALPTVSRIVDALMEMDWLEETGIQETAVGRPPVMVRIKPESALAIGVEIGRTVTRVVHLNLLGETVFEDHFSTAVLDSSEALMNYLVNNVRKAGDSKNIIGIGIAAPGSPNPHPSVPRREMDDRPDHHWHAEPLQELIEQRLGLPAWIENDANAAALGEMWFGVGQFAKHLLFVLADVGTGAGIAVNGSIYHGENNSAGEFAHTIVDIHSDRICECGRRGCLGGIAPTNCVVESVRQASGVEPGSFADVIEKAKQGMEPEFGVVSETLDYLAVGIMNLVQVLDPTVVVLGGATFLEDEYMLAETARRVETLVYPKTVSMAHTGFGANVVAVGAATLALQRVYDYTQLMDDPIYVRSSLS